MNFETAIVSAQARADAGTQDFTQASFGTPQAALVIFHMGATLDTDIAKNVSAYGLYDGTNVYCSGISDIHNSTLTSSRVITELSKEKIFTVYEWEYSARRTATAAWTTDGLRLTWDAGTVSRPYVTVVLMKGATNIAVGNYTTSGTDTGTTTVNTLGFTPNGLIVIGTGLSTFESGEGRKCASIGFATSRGSITQACNRISGLALINTSESIAGYDSVIASSGTTSERSTYTLTEFISGGFTIRTNSVTGADERAHGYIALNLEIAPDVFVGTTPTSGDWSPYTGTFQPGTVLMSANANTSLGHDTSGAEIASHSMYALNGTDEIGSCFGADDAVAATALFSRHSAGLIIQDGAGGAPVFRAHSPTFSSTGITYASANITHGASGYKVFGMAFEGAAGSTDVAPGSGTITVAGQTPTAYIPPRRMTLDVRIL